MIWKCNACQSEIDIPAETVMHFCPKCGANAEAKANVPGNQNQIKNNSCPVCCTEIQEGDDTIVCPDCKMVYHKDCWKDNNGCATYGCPQAGCLNPPPMKVTTQNIQDSDETNTNLNYQNGIRCPKCNTLLEEKATFCWSCNTDLKTSSFEDSKAPLAGHWERWFARSLDLAFETFILELIFSVDSTASAVALSCIYTPFALLMDSLIFAIAGVTLGKWLFGVKVVKQSDSSKVSGWEYFGRNFRMYWSGLGLGIPLVTILTQITQYNHVSAGDPTTYDKVLNMKVIEHNKKWYKTLAGGILFFGLTALPIIIMAWSK